MDKFKVGDSVKITNGMCGYQIGDIGEIVDNRWGGYLVFVKGRKSSSHFSPNVWFAGDSLELFNSEPQRSKNKSPENRNFKMGDYVILKSVRPTNWNFEGYMDHYLGKVMKISTIGKVITSSEKRRVFFENASNWFFLIEDIERLATDDECTNYRKFVDGEYVVLDNLKDVVKGNIGTIARIRDKSSNMYWLIDNKGNLIRGGSFFEKNLRFAVPNEIGRFKEEPKVQIAGYDLKYDGERELFIAGCQRVSEDFVSSLISYGSRIGIEEITIRGDKMRFDDLINKISSVKK